MPCISDYHDYPGKGMVNRSTHDLVTRVACKLADAVEKLIEEYEEYSWTDLPLSWATANSIIDEETYNWILSHRKMDEERKEKLKESALLKLTPEEKEALGL
jgi:hypothetical protein